MPNNRFNTTNSLTDMLVFRKRWADEGLRVVFTNGCFDLLHPGHICYLADARALGDRLIVGLNDDDSVRRLKGDDKHCPRPLNPLNDRISMLRGLRMVDAVIPFSEDTPFNLIAALLPDVLVKGGDYKLDCIVGADVVQQSGGHVMVVPFLDGYSSTRLIQRIQRAQSPISK